jgi:hypothetical protein
MANNDLIIIKGARVSFPHLFRRPIINGEAGKCGATLMFDPKKHAKTIRTIENAIDALCKLHFKGRKLPSDKLCLRDGNEKGRPEYEGYMVMSANAKGKPYVVSSDGHTQVTEEEDSRIYAGCYVNAKVRLWAQDNQYGKRINGELVSIQFLKDGEPLDGSYISVEEAISGFEAVEDDDDDFLNDAA